MLRRTARKILRSEIEEYETKIKDLKQKANDLIDENAPKRKTIYNIQKNGEKKK